MSEENNNGQTPPKENENNQTSGDENNEEMIPASRINNMRDQIVELRESLKTYESKEQQASAQQEEAERQKKIEQDKHLEVIQDLQNKVQFFEKTIADKDRDIRRGEIDRELLNAGISSKYARLGMVDSFMDGDNGDLTEWITKAKEADPVLFEKPTNPLKPGATGNVDRPAPEGDLETRLKSTDLAVARAANRERLEKQLRGEYKAD